MAYVIIWHQFRNLQNVLWCNKPTLRAMAAINDGHFGRWGIGRMSDNSLMSSLLANTGGGTQRKHNGVRGRCIAQLHISNSLVVVASIPRQRSVIALGQALFCSIKQHQPRGSSRTPPNWLKRLLFLDDGH